MTLLVSFDHTNRATVVPKTGVSRLLEFPLAMKNVERSLLALEQSIHDLDPSVAPSTPVLYISLSPYCSLLQLLLTNNLNRHERESLC